MKALTYAVLPPRNFQYQPRLALFAQIVEAFKKNVHQLTLVGTIGSGKTELAKNFVYAMAEDQSDSAPYDAIFWVDCTSLQTYQASCSSIRQAFPKSSKPTRLFATPAAALVSIQTLLATHPGRWLLVLDGAMPKQQTTAAAGYDLLSSPPDTRNGDILLTSTSLFWKNSVIRVGNFVRNESKELTAVIFHQDEANPAFSKQSIALADAANDFPATVTEAAEEASQARNVLAYANRLNQQEEAYRPKLGLPRFTRQVQDHLTRLAPSSDTEKLLTFMAQLSVVRIPRPLLIAWGQQLTSPLNQQQVTEALTPLIEHGLVELRYKRDNAFYLPLDIQLALREYYAAHSSRLYPYRTQLSDALMALCHVFHYPLPDDLEEAIKKEEVSVYSEHLRFLLERIILSDFRNQKAFTHTRAINPGLLATLLNSLAVFYKSKDLVHKAIECGEAALALLERTQQLDTIKELFLPDYIIAFPKAQTGHLHDKSQNPGLQAYCTTYPGTVALISLYTDIMNNLLSANLRLCFVNAGTAQGAPQINIQNIIREYNFIITIQINLIAVLPQATDQERRLRNSLIRKKFYSEMNLLHACLQGHDVTVANQSAFTYLRAQSILPVTPADEQQVWRYYMKSVLEEHHESYRRHRNPSLANPYQTAILAAKEMYTLSCQKKDRKTLIALIQLADLYFKCYQAQRDEPFDNAKKRALTQAIDYYKKAEVLYISLYDHAPTIDLLDICNGLAECYYEKGTKKRDAILYYLETCQRICAQLSTEDTHDLTKNLFSFYTNVAARFDLNIPPSINSFFKIRFMISPQYMQIKLDEINEKIRLTPENTWLYLQRAHTLMSLAEYDEAIKNYEYVLDAFPYSMEALMYRAEAYRRLGQYIEAIADFNYVQEKAPNAFVAHCATLANNALAQTERGLTETIPHNTELGYFITCFKEAFAIKLATYMERADGTDDRMPGYEIAGRIVKSLTKLIPATAKAAGLAFDLPPVGEAIDAQVDLATEVMNKKRMYSAKKVARIVPDDLKVSLDKSVDFSTFVAETALRFRDQIRILTYDSVKQFADYLAKATLHYLGSDEVVPFQAIGVKLRRGLYFDYKKQAVVLERKGWLLTASPAKQIGPFTAHQLVVRSGIITEDGQRFDPPGKGNAEKYGYQHGSVEYTKNYRPVRS